MKNNKLFKIFSIFTFVAVILLITAQSGICEPETSTAVADVTKNLSETFSAQDKLVKLGIALGGSVVAIIIITIGLMIYNKFFVDKRLFHSNDPNDVLNTPKTVDEAVIGFIKRNKL